jgi:hypothetical protein
MKIGDEKIQWMPAMQARWHAALARTGGLPRGVTLAAGAAVSMNIASDLGNTFGAAPQFGGPLVALGTLLAFVAFFALGASVTAPWARSAWPARWWRPWLTGALGVLVLWLGAQLMLAAATSWPRDLASPARYGSDEMYYAQYNAWLVLHGQNPYIGDRLSSTLRMFQTDAITPLRVGTFSDPLHPPTAQQTRALVAAYLASPGAPHPQIDPATTHSYPALSFVLAIPAVWAGLPTIGAEQIAALIALIALIVALAPPKWRWVVAGLCLLDVDGVRSVAGSDLAIWTTLGIALVWALCDRRWWAALALGLACAVQQTAWLVAPFYLVWAMRERGWRAALGESTAALGVFVLVNLPWIVTAPGPWLHSLTLPVALPLFPTGGGLVGLALGGALPLWPPAVYGALEIAAWLAILAAYSLRWWRSAPLAGLVLPLAPVLLAWRSPSRYFILLPLLVVLALVLTRRITASPNELAPSSRSLPDPHASLDLP